MLPHTQHTPACSSQRADHQAITRHVPRQLSLPERAVVRRLIAMFRTAMPEAAIHEEREFKFGKNKIRSNAKGRARHSVRAVFGQGRAALLRRLEVWAARQHGPTANFHMPPPAADAMPPHQHRQRQFRVLVPAPTNPRHHFRPLRLGKNVRHLILTTDYADLPRQARARRVNADAEGALDCDPQQAPSGRHLCRKRTQSKQSSVRSGITFRPHGACGLLISFSTKISLLTELFHVCFRRTNSTNSGHAHHACGWGERTREPALTRKSKVATARQWPRPT
jgi:hypothetical protein